MPIDASKYGSRPLDEEHFEYHIWSVEGLDLLSPGQEAAIDLLVRKALKKLGPRWELEHVTHGNVLPGPHEEKVWPQLVFRRPATFRSMSKAVIHRFYKDHDIRSSPLAIPNRDQWRMLINITFPQTSHSGVMKEYPDHEHSYPTLKKAHEAGFQYARRVIDGRIPN
jgi:hypothetical protein